MILREDFIASRAAAELPNQFDDLLAGLFDLRGWDGRKAVHVELYRPSPQEGQSMIGLTPRPAARQDGIPFGEDDLTSERMFQLVRTKWDEILPAVCNTQLDIILDYVNGMSTDRDQVA